MEDYSGNWYYGYGYWQPPPPQYPRFSRSGHSEYPPAGPSTHSTVQRSGDDSPVGAASRSPSPRNKEDCHDLEEEEEKKVSV